MHKGWLIIILFYAVLISIGSVIFVIRDNELNSLGSEQTGDEKTQNPTPLGGSEVRVVTLDRSTRNYAGRIGLGDSIRLCIRPHQGRSRPPSGWCSPPFVVASLSDSSDDSPWLSVLVPTSGGTLEAAKYFLAKDPLLLFSHEGDSQASDRANGSKGDIRRTKVGADHQKRDKGSTSANLKSTREQPGESKEKIVLERIDGKYEIFDAVSQLVEHAADSGVYTAENRARSVDEISKQITDEFFETFYRIAGRDTAVYLFGEVRHKEPIRYECHDLSYSNRFTGDSTCLTADLFFDVNESGVPRGDHAALLVAEVNRLGMEKKNCVVGVSGHADTSGPRAHNLRLSRKRAMSVAELLDNFPSDRIRLAACGESILRLQTEDGVSDRINRRVELTLVCRDNARRSWQSVRHIEQTVESLCDEFSR